MFNHRWVALAAGVALLAPGCGREDTVAGTLGDGHQLTIVMDEFSYEPSSLDLQAGASVTLTFLNVGAVDHEVMFGSSVADGGGYESDLLARMEPEVLSGSGYSVSFSEPGDMPGVAYFEGEGDHTHDDEPTTSTIAEDHAHDSTEPTDHHDGDTVDEPTTSTIAADHAHDSTEADDHHDDEADPTEADDHHDEDDHATDDHHEGDGGHHGDHVLVEPGGEVTIGLTVPDDAGGVWEMGCFIPGHYEGGMFGPVTVGSTTA